MIQVLYPISFPDAILVAVAIPLTIGWLRLVLRHLLAIDLALGRQNPLPQNLPDYRRGSSGGEATSPAPAYLAGPADDDQLIGGDPARLALPRGPAGATLTFRTFAPPSFDKEIPKVDLYGLASFVRTGKARSLLPIGSKRLLVINLQERMLAVHVPKRSKKMKGKESDGTSFSDYGGRRGPGGIRISFSSHGKKDFVAEDCADDPEDFEEAWDPRNFGPEPALLVRLDDLITVAAVPPRHGGVIEIASRLGTPPRELLTLNVDETSEVSKGRDSKRDKAGLEQDGRGPASPRKQPSRWFEVREHELHSSKLGRDGGPEYVTTSIKKDIGEAANFSAGDRRDEFVFCTPRDAAEFQRIIMALRAVGRDISYLYETLETIQKRPNASPDDTQEGSYETSDIFAPPGVPLDDALNSLEEIPILRKGLARYNKLLNQSKEGTSSILEENITQKGMQKRLGLVDFFLLFVPPFPVTEYAILPSITPCSQIESAFQGDPDLMLTRGIEWHYQNLTFVAALQRLVSRAALYVRVYAWARIIKRDGGCMNKEHDGPLNVELSACDAGVPMASVEENASAMVSEPESVWNSSDWSLPPVSSHRQGYSCVGWYALRSSPPRKERCNCFKGEAGLSPDSDPLERIPGIRTMVKKYPYAHFVIFSYFIEWDTVAVYFLLVRSLPVGVDRAFDNIVHDFVRSGVGEHDQRFRVSLRIGPGKGSSVLTKVTFRCLRGLCQQLTRTVIVHCPRKKQSNQTVLFSELLKSHLACFMHCGCMLEEKGDLLMNYVAINSQLDLHKYPAIVGKVLLWLVRVCLSKPSAVVITYKLRALSVGQGFWERNITTIEMTNIKLNKYMSAQTSREAEEKEGHNNIRDDSSDKRESIAGTVRKAAMNFNTQNDELHYEDVDTVLKLLNDMTVLTRKRNLTRGDHNQDNRGEIITIAQISSLLERSDIERYLGECQCDLKATVTRIAESAAWRGLMFPVDKRSCQVEMQSGQFFHQGHDKGRNPIFYFRNNLLGPWRGDIHATTQSILHRLETFLSKAGPRRPGLKITVIALMGHPLECGYGKFKAKRSRKRKDAGSVPRDRFIGDKSRLGANPRVDLQEEYCTHSNLALIQLLNDLIPRHYPGRIAKVLIVPKEGWKKKSLNKLLCHTNFPSQFAQAHVTVLSSVNNLKKYVDKNVLVAFAGGRAVVTSDAFHCDGAFDCAGT